jgi:hypothetical protein
MVQLIELVTHYKTCGKVVILGDLNTSINQGHRSYVSSGHDTRRVDLITQYMESNNHTSLITQEICQGSIGTFFP